MNVLVVGGTGFIGAHIVRALHRGGHGVPVVVVDYILSSKHQAEVLQRTFRGVAGRVVALSSGDVYRAYGLVNGTETASLESLPLSEDAALRRNLNPYSVESLETVRKVAPWVDDEYDKIPVEQTLLNDTELPSAILRLPMVYSPGDQGHRLLPIVKRIDDARPFILLGNGVAQWRTPRGYVGRVYNVAEPTAFSEAEWTRMVGRAAGWKGEVVVVPEERMPIHLRTAINTRQHLVYDTCRIREELGYREQIDVDEGINRAIAWERTHPPNRVDPELFDYAAEDAVER